MVFYLLSQLIRMVFGTLFPAYYSFKAVKNKNPKEYVHWMMYWIVFGFYSVFETFSDAFLGCWFPLYYEVKIIFQLWLLSSTTKGASTVYKIWVHPNLSKYENEIDLFLEDIQGKMKNGVADCGTLAVSYMSESFLRGILRVQQGFMKTATAVNYHSGGSGVTNDEMNISLSKMSPTTPDFDPFYENQSTSTDFFLENPQRKASRRSTRVIKKEDDVEDLNMTLDLDDDEATEEIITGTDDTDDSNCPEKGNSRAKRSMQIKPPAGIRREARRSKKKINPGGNSSDIPTLPLLPPMSLRNRHSTQQS